MRRHLVLPGLLALLLCISASALTAPDPSDGVSILLLLSEPYGANTGLLWNNFERLGWDVTTVGLADEMLNCSWLTTPIQVDMTVDEVGDLSAYDAIVIAPTPGTFQSRPFPAEDLRTDERALDLIREADSLGLSLYAGCSGLFVLGDAGVLESHEVVCHSTARNECEDYGATCTAGSVSKPPRFDGNIVTGTNQRYFALEIPEAIAQSLDQHLGRAASVDAFAFEAVIPASTSLEANGAITRALTLGTDASEGVRALCRLEDGFVAVGYTFSQGRSSDLLLLRFKESGELVWGRAFGGPGREVAEDVCQAANGDLIVAGYTATAGEGLEDAMVIRISSEGDLIWARTFGGQGADTATGVIWTENGEIAVCGRTESFNAVHSDLYILRLDSEGQEIWSMKTGGARYDRAHSLCEREDGSMIVVGGTTSLGSGNYDMYVIAVSPEGKRTLYKTYGLAQYDIAEDVRLTDDGGFVATGYGDQEGWDPNDVLAVRFDAEGNRLWSSRIGERKSFDYGEAVLGLEDGTFLVCGAMTSSNTGQNDVLLLHLDEEGKTLSQTQFGAANANEWAFDLCRLPSGGIAVAGHVCSDSVAKQDVLLLMVDPEGL